VSGVTITSGAQDNAVGGDTAGERNVLSGNVGNGVHITGTNTMSNTVSGNYIGVDASGTAHLGNGGFGVYLAGGAQHNAVGGNNGTPGGACSGECNLIAANQGSGIAIAGEGTNWNVVRGNYIGTDVSGTLALGGAGGVSIVGGAQGNLVGGDTAGERNVISGSGGMGVRIASGETADNVVAGNYIGTDASGTLDLGNRLEGVKISDARNNTVGPFNVIAHNDAGVWVAGGTATGNLITQNSIFSNTNQGIGLESGGNAYIAAPVIMATMLGSVHVVGTTCPACTVEVFANGDADGEGETYLGRATATAGGPSPSRSAT
jgi:titin